LNLEIIIYNSSLVKRTLTASGFSVGTGSDFKYGTKFPATKSLANFSKFSTLHQKNIQTFSLP